MRIEKSIAPPLSTLRPTKPTSSATFPVYHDLEALLAEEQQQPEDALDVGRHQKKRMDLERHSSANLPGPPSSRTRHHRHD